MKKCLSKKLLKRYINGKCSEREQRKVEAHIAGCEQCSQLMRRARAKGGEPAGTPDPAEAKNRGAGEKASADQNRYPTKSMPQASKAISIPSADENFHTVDLRRLSDT